MLYEQEQIKSIIIECINNLNNSMIESEKILTDENYPLFGSGSSLDSMGLLNLIIDIEEQLEAEGVSIKILDDHALSQKSSPFRTISTLSEYIARKIQHEP